MFGDLKRECEGNVLQVLGELKERGYVITSMETVSKKGHHVWMLSYYTPASKEKQDEMFKK